MKDQFEVCRPFWQYLARNQAGLDLLDDELREDGLNLIGPVVEFSGVSKDRRVFESEASLKDDTPLCL